MSKRKQTKDKAKYYPPEMMPFALCSACLDVVLEQSEKAADLYEEVIECLSLSGCQETIDQVAEWLPDNKSFIKELVKESGYDINKPPNKESFGIPYIRGSMIGGLSLIKGYANKLSPKVLKGKRRKRDLMLVINKIDEFIKVGFNSEKDKLKRKHKITIESSPILFNTIWFSVCLNICLEKIYFNLVKDHYFWYRNKRGTLVFNEDSPVFEWAYELGQELNKEFPGQTKEGFIRSEKSLKL